MEDLIKRSNAIDELMHLPAYRHYHNGTYTLLLNKQECLKALKAIPSTDRPRGEWIDRGEYAECLICGAHSGTQFDGVEPIPLKTNYCPNCGVRMKGVNNE